MKGLVLKLLKKAISTILILLSFIYITVLLNVIPPDFQARVTGKGIITSYPVSSMLSDSNEMLRLIFINNQEVLYRSRPLSVYLHNLFGRTMLILAVGLLLSIVIGIIKGIIDSKRGGHGNKSIQVLMTVIPISLPDVLIIVLFQLLAVFLSQNGIRIFKVAGTGTINHMLLPAITLSILPAFFIARTTTLSIDECYKQDYVKAALGKGCSRRRILFNHIIRNISGIVFESLSNSTAMIICNLMLVEYLFAYPGLTFGLMQFFMQMWYGITMDVNNVGIISIALIFGFIYFGLDFVFSLLKAITHREIKEVA